MSLQTRVEALERRAPSDPPPPWLCVEVEDGDDVPQAEAEAERAYIAKHGGAPAAGFRYIVVKLARGVENGNKWQS